MEQLTRELKERALALGFDLVGVARAGPTPGAEALGRWLDAGMHGEMGYMADTAALRGDPRQLLDGCQSLVMVAMSYRSSLPPSSASRGSDRVWVSRYAWGRDYHKQIKKRLVLLGRWLGERHSGAGWRAFVDTGPVMERAWAAAAGLGWIGRNTQLINRTLGSELFLGTLLCGLELAADAPTAAHCGNCTACVEACPTAAFTAPGVLDARRCIAYLTVEHRSEIPSSLAPQMANMVAGCDICQEVCPWNRRAPADLHPEFAPVPPRYLPTLDVLVKLNEDGFREWRAGSALKRIPYQHFRRCLAIVERNAAGPATPDTPKAVPHAEGWGTAD